MNDKMPAETGPFGLSQEAFKDALSDLDSDWTPEGVMEKLAKAADTGMNQNDLLKGLGLNVIEGPFSPHEAPCSQCRRTVKYLSTEVAVEVLCPACDARQVVRESLCRDCQGTRYGKVECTDERLCDGFQREVALEEAQQ